MDQPLKLIAIVRCKNGCYSAFNITDVTSGVDSVLHDVSQRSPHYTTIEACVQDSSAWNGPLTENVAETQRIRDLVPALSVTVFTTLDSILVKLLHGNIDDPSWCAQMRLLLTRCSAGPFDISTGDERVDPEPFVVVTNADRQVLAKCGPVRDGLSCFDALLFAASANALRTLLNQAKA